MVFNTIYNVKDFHVNMFREEIPNSPPQNKISQNEKSHIGPNNTFVFCMAI